MVYEKQASSADCHESLRRGGSQKSWNGIKPLTAITYPHLKSSRPVFFKGTELNDNRKSRIVSVTMPDCVDKSFLQRQFQFRTERFTVLLDPGERCDTATQLGGALDP